MAARPSSRGSFHRRHLGRPPAKGRRNDGPVHEAQYFERLCELRDDYRGLGPDDTTSVISIEAMIERAIELLDQPASPLIATIDQRDATN